MYLGKEGVMFDDLAKWALWIIFFLVIAGGITLMLKKFSL